MFLHQHFEKMIKSVNNCDTVLNKETKLLKFGELGVGFFKQENFFHQEKQIYKQFFHCDIMMSQILLKHSPGKGE